MRKRKLKKVSAFVEECLAKGITSPSEMRDSYNKAYPRKDRETGKLKPYSSDAFEKAIRRIGISATERLQMKYKAQQAKELKDIEEYEEVQRYVDHSRLGSSPISDNQIRDTLRDLRALWDWMSEGFEEDGQEVSYPNPREWTEKRLGLCMLKYVGQDASGWKNRNLILRYWGAFNRCFQGVLPKGWSSGLKRPAGELKDFFEFEEYASFEGALTDTETMSLEGWKALYSCEISMGCRGGSRGDTGIVSLRWQDINFKTRRCRIRDKGKKGQRARLWDQIPLDLFPWLHSWEKLMAWHQQCGQPTQGRVFKVSYGSYNGMFRRTRKRAGGRIAEDLETMRPHIFRKTHAQWGKRIGITLENLCGDTTESPCIGRYGVGWDDPKVPMKYYLTKEPWEYEEQDKKITDRIATMNIQINVPEMAQT